MADQVPVVPADVQQLQDALAVPPAQAGAAQDAQNIDGGDAIFPFVNGQCHF